MIYTIRKANSVSEQLRKFTTGYAHHVAGQFANIGFWIAEVKVSLKTIDEYNKRFISMRDGQKKWVDFHGTVVFEFCPYCGGKCELSNGKPAPPIRTSSQDLKEARRKLVDSIYYFLLRCFQLKLLDVNTLKNLCDDIGISIELSDIERR